MDSTFEPAARVRERIHRRRRVIWGELPAHEQEVIVDQAYAIWSEHIVGQDRDEFRRTRLFDDTRLHLLYGESGELAAFLNLTVDPVAVPGRRLLVVSAAFMSRLDYQAMVPLAMAATSESLRARLASPRHELIYVAAASSPISFGTLARHTPRYYPHVDGAVPPPHVLEVLAEAARRRNLVVRDDDPWVIHTDQVIRHPDRIRASRTMRDPDRFIRWFLERTPNWDGGDMMLVWIPLTPRNVLTGLMNMLRRRTVDARDSRST